MRYQYGETVVTCGTESHALLSAHLDGYQKKPAIDGRVHGTFLVNIPNAAWQSFLPPNAQDQRGYSSKSE
jgi:hypothetical protein